MTTSHGRTAVAPLPPRRQIWIGGGALVLAIVAVWHATFSSPFAFDDLKAVVENPTIRQLWPLTDALSPPTNGSNVTGRPLVNLSFALNYAISGLGVWSYHAFNVAIHAIASLALFGFVRRTLLLPSLRSSLGGASLWIGLLTAALWALHPLQTESVTSVAQRTESLMGCCFLLTCYAFLRGAEFGRGSPRWLAVSAVACLLGMASKEVMIAAPVLVLLFDRTFLAGSIGEAWRLRKRYYVALAATGLVLGAIVLSAGARRGAAAGLGLGVSPWDYLLTQCRAIVLYLRLALWPNPLVFDYGSDVLHSLGEVWAEALLVIALLAAVAVGCWRRPALGFVGAWFVVILAPSSSVIPLVGQTIAEHRMYLPLAAVVTLATLGAWRALGRAGLAVGFAAAVALGCVSLARNAIYRDPIDLWLDTAAKLPQSPRAHNNLANLLSARPARLAEAAAHYELALRLEPQFAEANNNLANLYAGSLNRPVDALALYEAAIRVRPNDAETHNNLAGLLAGKLNRPADALRSYQTALRLQPDFVEAHNNLAVLLSHQVQTHRGIL